MKARGFVDSGPVSQLLRCLFSSREPASDWDGVVASAVYHSIAPLLFKRLKQNDTWTDVPADAWERLRLAYLANAGRNLRLYRELRPVLQCMRNAGIPVIVLKGAFLAEAVYGDVTLRTMGDVDLMVPRAEMPRTHAVLLDMVGVHERLEDIESCCRRSHHLPPLTIRDLAVELHWTIVRPTGPFGIDAAGFWDRARPATIAGVEVLALSPEDLLLHLCLHFGYQHRLAWLRPFCDIAETIRRYGGELDWTQVAERAHQWRASRYVGLTLHLARSMLGTGVPGDVLERLAPGGIDRRLLEEAREAVLAQTDYRRCVRFYDMLDAKSFGDMARRTWKRIFLSRDEMAAKYVASRNSKHLWFYYALRLRDGLRALGSYTARRSRSALRGRGRAQEVSLANWLVSEEPQSNDRR